MTINQLFAALKISEHENTCCIPTNETDDNASRQFCKKSRELLAPIWY